jgi:prevent-host-death family protein
MAPPLAIGLSHAQVVGHPAIEPFGIHVSQMQFGPDFVRKVEERYRNKEALPDEVCFSHLGETLDRVVTRGEEFIVQRRGKPVAALISAAKFDRTRRLARRHAFAVLKQQKGGPLTNAQATQLGVEARRWARKERRKACRRAT